MTPSRLLLPASLLAVLLVGGCGAKPAPAAAPPTAPAATISSSSKPTAVAQPKTEEAVKAAAQEAFDRFASGDFAGAWETYTDEGRALISQADFVRLNKACPAVGIQVTVAAVRLDGDKATVRAQLGSAVKSYVLDYEHGQWLVEPSDTAVAEWKLGVDAAIAARKANGQC